MSAELAANYANEQDCMKVNHSKYLIDFLDWTRNVMTYTIVRKVDF